MDNLLNKDLQLIIDEYHRQHQPFIVDEEYRVLLDEQIKLQRELLNAGVLKKEEYQRKLGEDIKLLEAEIYAHAAHQPYCEYQRIHGLEVGFLNQYVKEKYE